MKIEAKKVQAPRLDNAGIPVMLTEETIQERKEKLLALMKEKGFSSVIVYADKEHGSNFEYLVGFVPRFEEALMVLNDDGSAHLILGNENANKAPYARIEAEGLKCSLFSLPNQPMGDMGELVECLENVSIDQSRKVGLAGWKLLPDESGKSFDMPGFIVDAVREVVDTDKLENATGLFISPADGVRVTNNANEIAHYEYGASLASDGVLDAMNHLEAGVKETEAGDLLNRQGQYNSVVTISAFGPRFVGGNLYPTDNTLEKGDTVALTTGYRGGLSSRSGYAVSDLEELPEGYLEEVVVPYFEAYNFWLENVRIGKNGGEFYDEFEAFYPKEKFGWSLCPGHLTSDEEWMSSPFYEGSEAVVRSGMLFQVDFIPSQEGYHGVSAESTVAIADENLRRDIEQHYPDLWNRIVLRREYMAEELGIKLHESILPLASTLGYYRPCMLDKETALVVAEG